jgi:hypothetical protein
MATFTQESNLGGEGSVKFTFDDVAMKLMGIKLTNNSDKYLDIYMISPFVFSRRINPGQIIERNLTVIERPTYRIINIEKNWGIADIIDGIEWRCCLGV